MLAILEILLQMVLQVGFTNDNWRILKIYVIAATDFIQSSDKV